ncbi:MAG: acetate kinase, partial [Bacteroidales bacterium]|nr:acetate kinase [Bacteroidales bacterium]
MVSQEVLAKGIVEKIGLKGSFLKNERNDGDAVKLTGDIYDHQLGIEYVLGVLTSKKHGSINDLKEIDAVGHRVVHGGEKFKSSVSITDDVIREMEKKVDLAPLHNPPNLKGIYAVTELMPEVPQVGVFDTSFHQTMPPKAYLYAIPYSFYKNYGIRRYGFHGTSHRYVSKRSCEILKVPCEKQKIITCHLGNGASIAAIKNGKSIDTSMGLTPVEGLIMGTRTGDIDAGVLLYLKKKEEISARTLNTLINKHSGMLGISGISSDMREITEAAENGNERAQVSLEMYAYRIKKYIGAYAAAMGGVDVIVFTGGIGENADNIREMIMKDMSYLGIDFDFTKNKGLTSQETILTLPKSKVKVMIVPTDEELVIAQDTLEIVKNL